MRFRSLSDAMHRFRDNNPPKVEVPQGHPLALVLGAKNPEVTPEVDSVLRWGNGSVWGVEPVSAYVFPNQLTDPDGEWTD